MTPSQALPLPRLNAYPRLNPFQNLGLSLLLLCLFFFYSRIFDVAFWYLHITALTFWLTVVAALFAGGALRAFPHRIGILLIAYYAWLLFVTPFSVWIGGSVEVMKTSLKSAPIFLIIAGLVLTHEHLRRAIHAFGFAILTLAILSFFFGTYDTGRLTFDRGRFANPNDLANIMLLAFPFWWVRANNPSLSRLRRLFAIGAMMIILFTMARTGSRGALLGFVVVGAVIFWRASLVSKLRIALGCLVLITAAALFLPGYLKERYFTFFAPDDDEITSVEAEITQDKAISSSYARRQLLDESIKMTLRHPVMGVGPGMFAVAQSNDAEARGQKGLWHVTHNTYTQVSSEAGIPGLIIFVSILIACYRRVRFYQKAGTPDAPAHIREIATTAFGLKLCLLAYCVSALFGSFAYDSLMPMLAGFVVALDNTGTREVAEWRASQREARELATQTRFSTLRRRRTERLAPSLK